jgi:peptide/nickel transport system ATP-binding protein
VSPVRRAVALFRAGWQLGPTLVVTAFLAAGVVGPWLASGRERLTDLDRVLRPPTTGQGVELLLGSDHLGRSELLRLVAGARGSAIAVLLALAGCLLLGGLVGVVAGWSGGGLDRALLRLVDVTSGLPSLLLGLVLAGLLGGSSWSVAVALAVTTWPPYARVIRSQIRVQRGEPRTQALTLLGASPWHILSRHLLPATSGPVVVLLGLTAAEVIVAVATFSYLGLGARPPVPEWGTMIVESQPYLTRAPWLLAVPTLAVTAVALSCTVLADRAGAWFTHGLGLRLGDATAADRAGGSPTRRREPSRPPVGGGRTCASPEQGPFLDVRGLTVDLPGAGRVVDGVDLAVDAGRTLALVGPSGSGKTMLALAVLGLFPAYVRPAVTGSARVGGRELVGAGEGELRRVRGAVVGYVPQDLGGALNPLRRVGPVIARTARRHAGLSRAQARSRAVELLREVGLADPRHVARQRPGALSGGMRQRVLLATALAAEPDMIIADEPTSALERDTAEQLVDLLADLQSRRGLAMVVITHDLGGARQLASTVAVMAGGRVVEVIEAGSTGERIRHPLTRQLLAAADGSRGPRPLRAAAGSDVLLTASGMRVHYPGTGTTAGTVAVHDVDLTLHGAEVLGLVGPSGCGKSSLARALAGIEPYAHGEVRLEGRHPRPRDGRIQLVFQDPSTVLDPRRTAEAALTEAARLAGIPADGTGARVREAFDRVGLRAGLAARRPWQLSGGERQRLVIARCLLTDPAVLLLDEPVSALDSIHRLEVLDLLQELRAEGLAMVLISHDVDLVARLADRVAVMRGGRIESNLPPPPVGGTHAADQPHVLTQTAPETAERTRR